jgi:hypothetical protein
MISDRIEQKAEFGPESEAQNMMSSEDHVTLVGIGR